MYSQIDNNYHLGHHIRKIGKLQSKKVPLFKYLWFKLLEGSKNTNQCGTAIALEQCINQEGTPHRHPSPKKIILIGKLNTHAHWILDPQPHPQPILMGENKKKA